MTYNEHACVCLVDVIKYYSTIVICMCVYV